MDAKLRILYNADTWDAATVTANSEVTDLEGSNVVHDFISLPWRSTGDTSEWIKFDLGSATSITCIGIFKHNLTSGATVTLEANATDSWGSPSYTQVLTIATDVDSAVLERIVFFLSESFQWWRITIADASNPDGYIQIGRIMAGAFYEFGRNFNSSFQLAMVDPSEGDETPGRQDYKRSRKRYRRATLGFTLQDRTQMEKLQAIMTKMGNSEPCILALDPTNYPTKDSMYCYLKTPLNLAHRFSNYFDTASLVFAEVTE